MARGPRGEKRPEDPAAAAVMTVQIAIGELQEELEEHAMVRNPVAVSLGRLGGLKGGQARANKLSPERRREIAQLAASRRWGSKRTDDG
jgi:hypothetical protein